MKNDRSANEVCMHKYRRQESFEEWNFQIIILKFYPPTRQTGIKRPVNFIRNVKFCFYNFKKVVTLVKIDKESN